ncbi:uncharacterized protein EDB93DRAFT_1100472 [Suillus bovinus]|uniref:uncharacterized protein n=1 Tax=Suillus bovinus TaxID=48563 RepID=UPI001B86812E|nr:uncharacterized protein EDB93DRAFT_1100472 [Suillus bovinus]KAG2158259.1 hypothetical protein EDB93DRAFT_1100472 [Suillus bovinus]
MHPAAKIPQGRSKGQKRSMPNSPPESPTLQPVPAPPTWEDCPDNTYEQDQGSFEPLQLPKQWQVNSQNDYLRQWLPRQESYLHHLLDQEAPPEDRRCVVCDQDGVYKCQDCLGEPLYCTGCCRSQHCRNPFHWISQWNGQFFEQSCLAHVGLVIHLGHDGKECPALTNRWDLFEGDRPEDQLEPEDLPSMSGPEFWPKENTMVIVNKSGVHRLEVRCCNCPNTMSPDIQMFRHGFFPASFNKPKTVFTFRVLDNFLLDNLECGTSTMNYYSKLRRMTSSMFPHLVLPGINISLSGNETLDDWKYTWSFVMDGNFKAEHLHPIKPFDEVWLADGLGFMVGNDSCNNHRAVNQANAARHKLESMGIGGVACAHHGCFVPHAMVDFQKGIGWMDGEIMETLWAHLNLISPTARGMSSPHRQECLDFQMNDSNFCKMICIKRTLCCKYKQAKNCIAESEKAFDRLDEAAPANLKTEWLAKERIAQSSRINDPAAMDVYKINIKKAPSKKEIELRLLEQGNAHNAAPSRRSVATWISMGLTIEEA